MTTRSVLACAAALGLAACATIPAPASAPAAKPAPAAARPAAAAPAEPWWKTAVFYEVFVRSFQDSDGDGIGDFKGLTARLDHLNDGDPATTADLGVEDGNNAVAMLQAYGKPECTALADGTFHAGVASHHGGEAPADGQA